MKYDIFIGKTSLLVLEYWNVDVIWLELRLVYMHKLNQLFMVMLNIYRVILG